MLDLAQLLGLPPDGDAGGACRRTSSSCARASCPACAIAARGESPRRRLAASTGSTACAISPRATLRPPPATLAAEPAVVSRRRASRSGEPARRAALCSSRPSACSARRTLTPFRREMPLMRMVRRSASSGRSSAGASSLAIGILAFNYWYTTKLVQRSAGHTRQRAAGRLHALPVVRARHRRTAWRRPSTSGRRRRSCRPRFAAGNDEAAKPVLDAGRAVAGADHPSRLRPRWSIATATPPAPAAPSTQRRRARCALFTDLRQGMSVDDALLEHQAAAPTSSPASRCSATARWSARCSSACTSSAVRRLQAADRRRSEEAGRSWRWCTTRGPPPPSAHADDWDEHRARDPSRGARDRRQDGDEQSQVLKLPDGRHDFFRGAAQRLRRRGAGVARQLCSSCATASSATQRIARHHPRQPDRRRRWRWPAPPSSRFGISVHRDAADPPVHRRHRAISAHGDGRPDAAARGELATPRPRCTSWPRT